MITHVVLFRLLPGVLPESDEARAFHTAMRALPGQIEDIRSWRCGFNTTPDELGWDYVLVAEFDSREALYRYFDHPAHVAVLGLAADVAELRFGDLDE